MHEEHEDGSFTLHMCEWYEQGRRLVGEYETLADGSGFAVTDEWPAGLKVVVNHQLTRPDGTVMPGISRLRRFDWKVGPDEGLHADDYEIWERELREQAERDRFDGELRSLGALGDGESIFGRACRAGLGQCGHRRRLGFDPFPDRVQVCARLGHVDDIPGPEAGGRGLRVLAPSLEFVAVACEPVVRVADDRVVAGDGRVRPLRVGGGSGVRVVLTSSRC